MRDDYIRSQQFLTVSQFLKDIFPVVDNHFQIELGHVLAGAAGAGGVIDHLPARIGKDKEQVFQRFQDSLRLADIGFRNV